MKARHSQLRWGQDARNSAGESIKPNLAKVNIRKLNAPAAALAAAPADSDAALALLAAYEQGFAALGLSLDGLVR